MSIQKLNQENFQAVIQDSLTLVDFYADWCGPCRMVAPIVEEIAEECPHVVVGKVNVDQSPELAVALGVVSIPTLIVFKDGKEINRMVGYRPKSAIMEALGQ